MSLEVECYILLEETQTIRYPAVLRARQMQAQKNKETRSSRSTKSSAAPPRSKLATCHYLPQPALNL